jgi:Mce-associated membrane protein
VTDDHNDDVTDDVTEDVTDAVPDPEATAEEIDESAAEIDGADADADEDDETTPDEPPRPQLLRRLLVPLVLAALLLSSVGLASWAYLTQFRPDQQTDAAVAANTIKAASDGTVALLSYSPESLDKDFAAAKTHLTGDFLTYYNQFTQDIVTPAAKQKSVKTSATVVRAAVAELKPESASVLLFLNQTTTSKENVDGSFTASSVKVGLTKLNGAWLISSFDPV